MTRRRLVRVAQAGVFCAAVGLALGSPAGAQGQGTPSTAAPPTTVAGPTTVAPPPGGPARSQSPARLSDSAVTPGQVVSVSGQGFMPNHDLTIALASEPVGRTRSDPGGRYSASVTIPANAPPGRHRIVVSGPGPQGAPHESTAELTLSLAQTGADGGRLAVLALGGVLLVLAGLRAFVYGLWSDPVSVGPIAGRSTT